MLAMKMMGLGFFSEWKLQMCNYGGDKAQRQALSSQDSSAGLFSIVHLFVFVGLLIVLVLFAALRSSTAMCPAHQQAISCLQEYHYCPQTSTML